MSPQTQATDSTWSKVTIWFSFNPEYSRSTRTTLNNNINFPNNKLFRRCLLEVKSIGTKCWLTYCALFLVWHWLMLRKMRVVSQESGKRFHQSIVHQFIFMFAATIPLTAPECPHWLSMQPQFKMVSSLVFFSLFSELWSCLCLELICCKRMRSVIEVHKLQISNSCFSFPLRALRMPAMVKLITTLPRGQDWTWWVQCCQLSTRENRSMAESRRRKSYSTKESQSHYLFKSCCLFANYLSNKLISHLVLVLWSPQVWWN